MLQLTLLIEEKCGISSNQIYEAAATYLRSKIGDSSNLNSLRVSKTSRQQGLTADIVIGQSVMDSFQDINWLKWKLCAKKKNKDGDVLLTYFELSFEKKFKEVMPNSYLPHIISMKHGRGTKGAAPTSDAAGRGDAPGTPLPAHSAVSCHVDSTCF